jgi:osmotically-inducible protein OsmY
MTDSIGSYSLRQWIWHVKEDNLCGTTMRIRRETGVVGPSPSMLRAAWIGVALCTSVLLGSPLHGQYAPAPADAHDLRITLRARRALSQDAELGWLNIGVSVRQGFAMLWGRAPSQALEQRAVQQVQKVQGVFRVRSELRIEPVERERDETPSLPLSIRLPSIGRDPRSPGVLAGNPRECEPERHSMRDAAWLALPVPPQEPPALLLKPRPAAASEELVAGVTHLIRSDTRFAGVEPEVQEGVVTLRGTVALMDHAMDLARQISRLRGVTSVVVEQVRVAPNP